jgi:hypothetical protein
VGNRVTRATIVWVVAAAVVGSLAGVLWLLRSDLGGGRSGTPIVVGSIGLTLLAACMLYHGIMVAAREQDRRADLVAIHGSQRPQGARPQDPPPADDEPLTFHRGTPI